MTTLTNDQARIQALAAAQNCDFSETDLEGQVLIYTGIYRHPDGSLHQEAYSEEEAFLDGDIDGDTLVDSVQAEPCRKGTSS